jgi:hypothetical protein
LEMRMAQDKMGLSLSEEGTVVTEPISQSSKVNL